MVVWNMVDYLTIIKMGMNKSFVHLVECIKWKNLARCFIIPRLFFAFMIFSLRCFSKDKSELSIKPRCFCSFTFATTVPLNVNRQW